VSGELGLDLCHSVPKGGMGVECGVWSKSFCSQMFLGFNHTHLSGKKGL